MSDAPIALSPQNSTVSSFPVRQRLLVVDDEPLILEGLARLLATRDYDVVTANGGCEALIAIGKQQFDAILLDLGMPDLDGNEVLRFVADRSVGTPVIVVSGDSTIDAAIRALRGGAADFVRKPYEPEELLRRIDNTLTRRRLEKENNHILQRLQQSEKWHRFLVNSSPDFIYTLDCEGRFTFVNDRVESLLGYRQRRTAGPALQPGDSRRRHRPRRTRVQRAPCRRPQLRATSKSASSAIRAVRRPRLMNCRCKSVELHRYRHVRRRSQPVRAALHRQLRRREGHHRAQAGRGSRALPGLPRPADRTCPTASLFNDRLGLGRGAGQAHPAASWRCCSSTSTTSRSSTTRSATPSATNCCSQVAQRLQPVPARRRHAGAPGRRRVHRAAAHLAIARATPPRSPTRSSQMLSKPFYIEGHELYISASIGDCDLPGRRRRSSRALMRHADIAMYQAKTAGPQTTTASTRRHAGRPCRRMQLEADAAPRARAQRAGAVLPAAGRRLKTAEVRRRRGAAALAAPGAAAWWRPASSSRSPKRSA